MKATKKKPTAAQVRAIYNGGLKAYGESYAMMVDDILYGMVAPCKKASVSLVTDVEWFYLMSRKIRNFVVWDRLPETDQLEIVNAVQRLC